MRVVGMQLLTARVGQATWQHACYGLNSILRCFSNVLSPRALPPAASCVAGAART